MIVYNELTIKSLYSKKGTKMKTKDLTLPLVSCMHCPNCKQELTPMCVSSRGNTAECEICGYHMTEEEYQMIDKFWDEHGVYEITEKLYGEKGN